MKVQFVLTITCSPSSPPLPRQFNPQEAREMRTPPDDAKRVSPGAARPRLFGRNLRGREIGEERRRRLAPRRRRRRSPERERRCSSWNLILGTFLKCWHPYWLVRTKFGICLLSLLYFTIKHYTCSIQLE